MAGATRSSSFTRRAARERERRQLEPSDTCRLAAPPPTRKQRLPPYSPRPSGRDDTEQRGQRTSTALSSPPPPPPPRAAAQAPPLEPLGSQTSACGVCSRGPSAGCGSPGASERQRSRREA
ncbi:Protein of unknown function [Gryllus bimaculatus]|nr:Protein of unknown function [Gryllus bimaculatus]